MHNSFILKKKSGHAGKWPSGQNGQVAKTKTAKRPTDPAAKTANWPSGQTGKWQSDQAAKTADWPSGKVAERPKRLSGQTAKLMPIKWTNADCDSQTGKFRKAVFCSPIYSEGYNNFTVNNCFSLEVCGLKNRQTIYVTPQVTRKIVHAMNVTPQVTREIVHAMNVTPQVTRKIVHAM